GAGAVEAAVDAHGRVLVPGLDVELVDPHDGARPAGCLHDHGVAVLRFEPLPAGAVVFVHARAHEHGAAGGHVHAHARALRVARQVAVVGEVLGGHVDGGEPHGGVDERQAVARGAAVLG